MTYIINTDYYASQSVILSYRIVQIALYESSITRYGIIELLPNNFPDCNLIENI